VKLELGKNMLRKNHYNTYKKFGGQRRPVSTMRSLLIREMLHRRNNEVDPFCRCPIISEINPATKGFVGPFKKNTKQVKLSLLDVFAGGGSIPFESARLGFKTFSI